MKKQLDISLVTKKEGSYGHAHIISYRFLFGFTKLYGMMWTHFSFNIYVEYEFRNFEHYFNVLMEKTTIWKIKNRKYSNNNNKRMSKVLKIDFVLKDNE